VGAETRALCFALGLSIIVWTAAGVVQCGGPGRQACKAGPALFYLPGGLVYRMFVALPIPRGVVKMSNKVKKMPVTSEDKGSQHPATTDLWRPLEKLRQQVDHLFEDFNRGSGLSPFSRGLFDVAPFWRRELIGQGMPAVDITEKDKSYEITAELPGMDQKSLELKLSNGSLIIRGGKERGQGREKKGLSP
jgi:hypothetical protein